MKFISIQQTLICHLQCSGVVLGAGERFRIEPAHSLEEGTIWLGSQSHEQVTPGLAGQTGDRGIRGRALTETLPPEGPS